MRKLFALCALLLALTTGLSQAYAAPAAGGSVPAYSASASVSDATPAQGRSITVTGRLLAAGKAAAGVQMRQVWHYRTYTVSCTATTDRNGRASCIHNIRNATRGYAVRVDITFLKNGKVIASSTARFVPREGGKG